MTPLRDPAAGVRAALRLLRGGNVSMAIAVLEALPEAIQFEIKHHRAAAYIHGRYDGEAAVAARWCGVAPAKLEATR